MRLTRLAVPLLLAPLLLVASAPPVACDCSSTCPAPVARGHADAGAMGLTSSERSVLKEAQAATHGLEALRGGEISDHDLKVVAVVLLGVIALALIF